MYLQSNIWRFLVILIQSEPDTNRTLSQRGNITGSNKAHLDLRVKGPIFLPVLTKFVIYRQIFMEVSNVTFHVNPSSDSRDDTGGHIYGLTDRRTAPTDRRTDMTFVAYANAPE